jgi:hypothetical protein
MRYIDCPLHGAAAAGDAVTKGIAVTTAVATHASAGIARDLACRPPAERVRSSRRAAKIMKQHAAMPVINWKRSAKPDKYPTPSGKPR